MTFKEFKQNLLDFDFFRDVKDKTPALLWESYISYLFEEARITEILNNKFSEEIALKLKKAKTITDSELHIIYTEFFINVEKIVDEIMDEYIENSKKP